MIGSVCTGIGGLDLGVLAALSASRIIWCADPDPHITTILKARWSAVLIRGPQGQRGGEAVTPRPGHRAGWGLLGDAHCLLGVHRGVLDHRISHGSQARLRKEGRQ